MVYWQFFDYITEGHRNSIRDWYGTVDRDVQAAFDVLVQELAGTKVWDTPEQYRLLTGAHIGMCELIFKVGSRKFRPLGVLYLEKREFVLLGGCEHRRWESIPPNAFDEAYRLKTQLDEGKGATCEHV
jgi:hypothetical protein